MENRAEMHGKKCALHALSASVFAPLTGAQKTLLPPGSLFFCSFSCFLSSWICASGYPLFRLLCRTVQSGPEVKPTWAQVGPNIGPSWAQNQPKLGLSWAQVGPSWRKLAPTWLIWAQVALKFALAASPGWPASPRTSEGPRARPRAPRPHTYS